MILSLTYCPCCVACVSFLPVLTCQNWKRATSNIIEFWAFLNTSNLAHAQQQRSSHQCKRQHKQQNNLWAFSNKCSNFAHRWEKYQQSTELFIVGSWIHRIGIMFVDFETWYVATIQLPSHKCARRIITLFCLFNVTIIIVIFSFSNRILRYSTFKCYSL